MKDQEMELKEKKEVKKVAGEGTRPGPVFIPAVDILENTNEIIVLADRLVWKATVSILT